MKRQEIPYHLKCRPGEVGKYCILCGDPARCKTVAQYYEDAVFVSENREFTIYTGTLLGEKVSVASSGIGGPSAAIAVEELADVGVHTFIRVGTCGGISLDVRSGDIVVATGAVRMEGTSREYAPAEYPAVADFQVTSSLVNSAAESGKRWHAGVVQCKDSFYGQHDPDRMPVSGELKDKWEAWKGLRAGSVFHVIWNQEREAAGLGDEENHDVTAAVVAAVEALKKLIVSDRQKQPLR